ncbi:MAG: ATPase, T2SS/T4P/T4SS family [Planctomycetota bacterium]
MAKVSLKIKRLLVAEGLVTAESWDSAARADQDPVKSLLASGELSEGALLEVMGCSAGVPPVDLRRIKPDSTAIESVAPELCRERSFLPISKNGDVLTIVVSDPFDVLLFDDLKRLTHCHVRPLFAHSGMIATALDDVLDGGKGKVDQLVNDVANESELEVKEESDSETQDIETNSDVAGEDAPAVKLANAIVLGALKAKASDIHIEPGEKTARVRYRVDGRLRQIMTPPKSILPALTSRLKILASLDIAERHKPQDGKFRIRFQGRNIDFRLSILPVVGGEKSVIRILDTGSMAMKLETMGYEPKSLEDIKVAIDSPYGMLLVTGPTGSGKSTTLYSCVQAVATPEVNVTTVEDPVEYRMDGIAQVPVNPKRGTTFAGALRSILRQDPDIVLVGEIRDRETADIAVKAALTGHLVLSTLHTNDAAATITRLVDMGIDPFMVSSSILCIVAQRLGRKLCENCKVAVERPVEGELRAHGFIDEDFKRGFTLFDANREGCPRCTGGYKGRFPIVETMPMTQDLRRMVVEGASKDKLKDRAVEEGMLTLRRVALLNAMRGITSIQEVLRVTLDN